VIAPEHVQLPVKLPVTPAGESREVPVNTIAQDYAEATDWALGTLEDFRIMARPPKGKYDRQKFICVNMVSACLRHNAGEGMRYLFRLERISKLVAEGRTVEAALAEYLA